MLGPMLLFGIAIASADWLIHPISTNVGLDNVTASGCIIELSNSLVSRRFAVPGSGCSSPNFGTVDLLDMTQSPPKSVLAALDPEAVVELDGVMFPVGGSNQTCQGI